MKWLGIFFLVFLCASGTEIEPGDPEDIGPDAPQGTLPTTDESTDLPKETQTELQLDERIRQLLQHFKQDDPRGIPGVPIPDPMPIPPFEGDFPAAKIRFSDAELQQLSQFKIDYVRTDLKDLKVWIGLTFDSLQVVGRYRMSSWFSTSSGDFNVTLIKVNAEGYAGLVVDEEGLLQASDITFGVGFKDIAMKFDNLGFFGSLFQGIINSVGTFIFDSIKPMILNQISEKVQTTVNTKMREIEQFLPDSVPPLDMAMALARSQIQDMEMDPFKVPDYETTLKTGVGFKLYDGIIQGLSTVHRTGDVTFKYEDGHLVVGAQASTQRLQANFKWQMDYKFYVHKGEINLKIDYLDIKIGLKQPINVEKKPRLEVLRVTLGNVQARSSGTGSLDYLIEFTVNFLFNGFKNLLLQTIEKPVTTIIQKELDKLDIEAMIEEQLSNLNNL